MRLYIAGPITGVEHHERFFKAAAFRLSGAGYEPVSPTVVTEERAARYQRPEDDTWQMWMRATARLLIECDGVALLPGWRGSRGAMIEADWAEAMGLPVRELEDWL